MTTRALQEILDAVTDRIQQLETAVATITNRPDATADILAQLQQLNGSFQVINQRLVDIETRANNQQVCSPQSTTTTVEDVLPTSGVTLGSGPKLKLQNPAPFSGDQAKLNKPKK